ncbi:hypothetical protein M569_15560, partial [Genlisea aurea]
LWDLPDVPGGELPPHLQLQRTRVLCTSEAPTYTENIQYSGAYALMGVDNSLPFDSFRENFRVEIVSMDEHDIEFDLIGIDAAIANAFRRILIAELPTMAIEKVLIANNTSVIPDEVLSHRLGLIPLKVDPRPFSFMSEHDEPNEKNTVVFKLHVSCERKGSRKTVKTDELKWLPNGSELRLETERPNINSTSKIQTYTSFNCSQDSMPEFSGSTLRPTSDEITIARLGPGQEIELEAHAVKGMGKTHAKWSPVATAWYRLLPEIALLDEIKNKKAKELVKKCPQKVFDIEDAGGDGIRATVARPRNCSLCRECIRDEEWEKLVSVRRVKDHFIFKIESTGALPPEVLFTEAVKILEEKCENAMA